MADESILTSIKKTLNIDATDTSFDTDVRMHINAILSTLHQIGVGPDAGFEIGDANATWEDLLGTDPQKNNVKSYIYTKVKLLFDPPTTSFGIKALEDVAREFETRIYLAAAAAEVVTE